jgi:hypothetical protein
VGRNRKYLLQRLSKSKIAVKKLEIIDEKHAKITIDKKDSLKYFAICKNSWYNKLLKIGGLFAPLYKAVKNPLITIAVIFFFSFAYFADGIYLKSVYLGDSLLFQNVIDNHLEEAGITKFKPFSQERLNEVAIELQKQAGKYYALNMEEKLFGSTKYIGGSTNTMGHTEAQRKFINSKYGNDANRYAILAEGVWWENEAEDTFKENETNRGDKKSDRRFSFMPIPKANETLAGAQTMLSLNNSYGFINKDSQNMELAKEFMRFLHTDAEMSKFSAKTSIPRSLNYSVSSEDRATATHFGKSLIDMRATAKVIYPYSSTSLVLNNPTSFDEIMWFSTTKIGKTEYTSPMKVFQGGDASAAEYFNGLYAYQQGKWSTLKK